MQVIRHTDIEKDFKSLKRFPTPKESLEAWERLFCLKGLRETPGIDPFPGFGQHKIFKARVVPLGENCGKSKGYRLIFQLLENEINIILVFSRHGIYNNEQELIDLIKNRIQNTA
jgi:mRNA-degrading endonuclease RelE of RelBE toxin-antitoxin system